MNQHPPTTPGKTSSDSGQSAALDRWSQRRLQRLNTEQGFREQRQGGGQGILSPPTSISDQTGYNSTGVPYPSQAEPQPPLHQQAQPHPSQQPAYQSARTVQASHPNAGLVNPAQAQAVSSSTRTPYQQQETSQSHAPPIQQYSPPDSGTQYISQENSRPQLGQTRSYSQQQTSEDPSMSSSNNGTLPAPKAVRSGNSNRQSMHNGLNSRDGSALGAGQNGGQQQGGVPAFSASVVPPTSQGQAYQSNPQLQKTGDIGRVTPQPVQSSEDMSEEDINQLIKDHKELRSLPLLPSSKP